MKKIYLLIYIFCLAITMQAQQYDPLHPPNTYRNADNPYYWKNRQPYSGYWQQDTYYQIKATLDDKTDIIDGTESLTYWNNSPDTLRIVYFHLYQNAFQPGSYLDNLQKSNGVKVNYSRYERDGLGTVVEKISSNGIDFLKQVDNTIMKVDLAKPLLPGDSVVLEIKFKTYYGAGSTRRRMKMFEVFGYKHYDGVQWYPRISVYDRKFGWTADQHLNREFYGDYGAYDVEFTIANFYLLEATGNLLNKEEVLPDSVRKKLDIKNFANKEWNSIPSMPIIPDGTNKTWKYHAENVHDFAFTADPTYRIGEAEWNGIKCIAMVEEPHASRWQNAAAYTAKIIKTYSTDFGMYAYPKIVVADAQDGMEYPMLTLDGGGDPSYRSLFAHEVGHQWFFGMVGNNETYRAMLDEGFTQFLNAWCLDALEGKYGRNFRSGSKYVDHFRNQYSNMYLTDYIGYLNAAISGEDGFINTHSDHFNGALGHGGGYGQVYRKTATMLYNLQYVLGDSLFLSAMQHYFSQWKFCHPYPEDFRNSIIQFTHVDLNWFFDEWIETNKRIDYGICSVKKISTDDDYEIKFVRKGEMEMPIDFTVYASDEKKYSFHIPNRWFVKEVSDSVTVLPKWFGWDKLNPTYTAKVRIPGGIDDVVIDTTHRLADINMLNNSSTFPAKLVFDSQIANAPDWLHYEMKARPDVWWNQYDGFKVGFHLDGNYMNYFHKFDLNAWINTGMVQANLPEGAAVNGFDQFSFNFKYETATDRLSKNSSLLLSAKLHDGLSAFNFGMDQLTRKKNNRFYFRFESQYRKNISALLYLLYPEEWIAARYNNNLVLGLEHTYSYSRGSGDIDLHLRSSSLGSAYDFSSLTLSVINKNNLGKFNFNTRVFAQYATGSNFPRESSLFLAGANPEELMNDKFTRSKGYVPDEWLGYGSSTNHFQQSGGLNLRGYAGYLATQLDQKENIVYTYKGTSGAGVNAELYFDRLFRIAPKFTRNWLKINSYLFGDAGVINYNNPSENIILSDLRADAGMGFLFTIKKFWKLQTVNPFTIRIDFPVVLNHPPAEETDYIKFRYVVGVGKSF